MQMDEARLPETQFNNMQSGGMSVPENIYNSEGGLLHARGARAASLTLSHR